jgi:hypothetical protein
VLQEDIDASPIIDLALLNPLKGIPGLLDQTISVVNEKIAGMQVGRPSRTRFTITFSLYLFAISLLSSRPQTLFANLWLPRAHLLQQLRAQPSLSYEQFHQFGDLAHGLKSGLCMIGCSRISLICYKMGLSEDDHSTFSVLSLFHVLGHLAFILLRDHGAEGPAAEPGRADPAV